MWWSVMLYLDYGFYAFIMSHMNFMKYNNCKVIE